LFPLPTSSEEEEELTILMPAAGLIPVSDSSSEDLDNAHNLSIPSTVTTPMDRRIIFSDTERAIPLLEKTLAGLDAVNRRIPVTQIEERFTRIERSNNSILMAVNLLLTLQESDRESRRPRSQQMPHVPEALEIDHDKLHLPGILANS